MAANSFLTREGYQKLQEELEYLRTTKREFADPGHRSLYIGFRCAANP